MNTKLDRYTAHGSRLACADSEVTWLSNALSEWVCMSLGLLVSVCVCVWV